MIRFIQFCGAMLVWATMSVAWSQTMISETGRMALDTAPGNLTLESDWRCDRQVNLRLSSRWSGADSAVLLVNGVEWATLTAGEERDLFLTLPANTGGDYVCDFLFGGNAYRRTIRTTGVRKTASGASVALDTRTGGRVWRRAKRTSPIRRGGAARMWTARLPLSP